MENVVYEPLKSLRVGDPPTGTRPRAVEAKHGAGGHSRRRALGTAFAVGLGVAALGGAPAVASAADDCPNAAVRAQQQSQHLPNCMAYEKVTPGDKGGEQPGVMQVTEDGNGVTLFLNAGIADAQGFVSGRYRSLRSPDGRWATDALMPAMDGPVLPALNAGMSEPNAVTPDLSRIVFTSAYGINPNDQGIAIPLTKSGTRDVFLREANGGFRWLVPDPSVVDTSTQHVFFAAGSSDLERVVVGTKRPWDPRVVDSNEEHLYVWSRNGTQLVTVLPNGDPATGLTLGEPGDGTIAGVQASSDARRIAFSSGDLGATRAYVRFNADDPATAFTREVAVGPDGQPCDGARIVDLSADGRHIIFSCNSVILPGGPASGTYIRDLDRGSGAVRLLSISGVRVAAGTADYSRVYLVLTGEDGIRSLFLMRDGGEPELVVPSVELAAESQITFEMSADGEYVGFRSSRDLGLPGVDHSTLNGAQVYLYAARTRTLTCVSCRKDGSPTEGPGAFGALGVRGGGGSVQSGMRPVSTSGTVVFSSLAALVPEDANGQADAYAWIDGRAVLLSRGQSPMGSVAQGGSTDGSSLFLRTTDALVADDRDGGVYDVYVARANGGTLLPEPPPAPCTANCQVADGSTSPLPNASTSSFVGRGNLVVETTKTGKSSRASASLTVSRSVKGSSTTVRVKVSRAGSIRVSGVGLRQVTVKVKKAGTYRVTVRLSAHGVQQQRSRGRLATRVTARFTPQSGASVSARKSVTFTAEKGGR